MRVAIVGSGIAGLASAHWLRRRHEITLFEADARIGGHAHTVDVELDGERHAIDTGFIVYNERTYPLFSRLLTELGIASQPSDMSFSVQCEASGLAYASHGLNALFAQRRNLLRRSFRRLLRDAARFNGEAKALLAVPDEKATLGDYLCGNGYCEAFVTHYVIPMGAAIWSASPREFLTMPAVTFARFFDNHGLLDRRRRLAWRVVSGGSGRYVEALARPFRDRIRTGCPVRGVRRLRGGVEVASAAGVERFDRIVLAVHSDQALRLLRDPSDAEWKLLGAIRYQENEAVLHTDASVMPGPRRAWASWNYRIPGEVAARRVFVSYHMNRLQGLRSRHDFFVTLNPPAPIASGRVLGRLGYHHPVIDTAAVRAQAGHAAIDGVAGTHYCGAYWGYGFHEDGVRSALAVARRLGCA